MHAKPVLWPKKVINEVSVTLLGYDTGLACTDHSLTFGHALYIRYYVRYLTLASTSRYGNLKSFRVISGSPPAFCARAYHGSSI